MEGIAVYSFTKGELSDTAADVFVKHMADGIFTTVCTIQVLRELFNNARNQLTYRTRECGVNSSLFGFPHVHFVAVRSRQSIARNCSALVNGKRYYTFSRLCSERYAHNHNRGLYRGY